MKYNFTIRIWKDLERNPYLSDLSSIVVSDIKILTNEIDSNNLKLSLKNKTCKTIK